MKGFVNFMIRLVLLSGTCLLVQQLRASSFVQDLVSRVVITRLMVFDSRSTPDESLTWGAQTWIVNQTWDLSGLVVVELNMLNTGVHGRERIVSWDVVKQSLQSKSLQKSWISLSQESSQSTEEKEVSITLVATQIEWWIVYSLSYLDSQRWISLKSEPIYRLNVADKKPSDGFLVLYYWAPGANDYAGVQVFDGCQQQPGGMFDCSMIPRRVEQYLQAVLLGATHQEYFSKQRNIFLSEVDRVTK